MILNYNCLFAVLFFALTVKYEVNCGLSDLFELFKASRKLLVSDYNYTITNLTTIKNSSNGKNIRVVNVSVQPDIERKKLQIGRVTSRNRPYAVVNMLWRKTKIFQDQDLDVTTSLSKLDNTSEKNIYRHPKHTTKIIQNKSIISTSPSFIQYYHLEDSDLKLETTECSTMRLEKNVNNIENWPYQHFADFKLTLQNPVFSFHVNPHEGPPINSNSNQYRTSNWKTTNYKSSNIFNPHDFQINRLFTMPHKSVTLQRKNVTNDFSKNIKKTVSLETTTSCETAGSATSTIIKHDPNITSTTKQAKSSQLAKIFTADPDNDKIKFFEMYDKNTFEPILDKRDLDAANTINVQQSSNNQLSDVLETLDKVNQNIGHGHNDSQKTKHAKKHIVQYEKDNSINSKGFELEQLTTKVKNASLFKIEGSLKKTSYMSQTSHTSIPQYAESKHANWSNYPFVAVYIYEPLQVHCDAAAISRHWLICAGSCLSRHHKNPGGMGRSAFVSYCGETWWEPERVAYVKYSIIHPGYHPRDKTRKRLYNIGLIQVVDSMMSSCAGLLPISLISHQFSTVREGSRGTAVGWGLDRFDSKYPTFDLPRSKLFVYESEIYSESCPGNSEYSKAMRLDDLGGTENVYCLALPPYQSEENDSVHGTLLLSGGKLIALYLQEERRPWGQQCAEYTGTWRLMPWILEIAREPEEFDPFDEI